MAITARVDTVSPDTDAYLVLFEIDAKNVGILVVLRGSPLASSLKKLSSCVETDKKLRTQLKGFEIQVQTIQGRRRHEYQILFGVSKRSRIPLDRFLEFARQCRVLNDVIECDTREFKIN